MNNVSLLGNLVRDVDIINTKNGKVLAKFTLAVARKFKKDETDFINCIAFGKTAEIINQYVGKGQQFAITGNIRTGSYEAQDGTRRYTTDVVVESFDFVSGGKHENQKGSEEPCDGYGLGESIDDSDCPF